MTGAPGPEACAAEAKAFAGEIKAELEKRGLLGEKLGLGGFDGTAREALINAGIKNIVDTRNIILEARMIKNQEEISCLKTCAAMVDGVWFRIWEGLKPGMRDTDLMTLGSTAGYELGLESAVPGGWRTGPMTFDRGPHATSRVIQFGDLVYGSYCGATYMGYGSCTYRTFIVGRQPTAKEKDWYKVMRDRIDAIIGEIKPGRTTADAAKHFPPASKWGYKSEVEVLASEIGHGIGLGTSTGYDAPIINRLWSLDHPQVFEEGMRILICGGGDGLALRECLRFPGLASVDLVDYDPEIIELARTRFAEVNSHDPQPLSAGRRSDGNCSHHQGDRPGPLHHRQRLRPGAAHAPARTG